MSRALPMLSERLSVMINQFHPLEEMTADQVAEFDAASIKVITSNLRLMQKVAVNMEQELNVYRLIDTGRVYSETVEQLATEAAATFVLNNSDNVIRPNFGRKRDV